MELMEAIRVRKSYRGAFAPTPIPREEMRQLLGAGALAPTGCNLQTTRFISVDDPALARKLAEIYGKSSALSALAAILLVTKETPSPSGVSYHVHGYSAAAGNILPAISAKGYASV